jgi:hypothetical protein
MNNRVLLSVSVAVNNPIRSNLEKRNLLLCSLERGT